MVARISAALILALALTGCDALCEFGIGDKCAPCETVGVPDGWKAPALEPLLPPEGAVVCEADAEPSGQAKMTYWVPGKVHETNMSTVGAAQDAGWARLQDNWYDTNDSSQMPKWSTLGVARGDRLRIEVEAADRNGSFVKLAVEGVPPPPQLRGDVTIFSYRQATFALFDGHMAILPGVTGKATLGVADGFFYRAAPDQYGRYQPDGTVLDLAPFPTGSDRGHLSVHGKGPSGMPWMSFNPRDPEEPLLLGELAGEAWTLERVADVKPPLPNSDVDAVHTRDGRIWLLCGNVLYVKDTSGWRGTKLKPSTGALRPIAAESDSVLISTEGAVLRVRLDEGRFTITPVAELEFYPELRSVGTAGVVARTNDRVMLIQGDQAIDTHLPGESAAPDIATNEQGVIAVATKNPSTLLVRDTSGTVTRYPTQGTLPGRVFSMAVDPLGRVWTLMVDGDPLVADNGSLVPLEGLVGKGLRPSAITFMGNGAPPFLEAAAKKKNAERHARADVNER